MATIKDIAKMAGVSTATVSRIINGKGEAKQETIDRVMTLVKEVGYQPNRLAKSLSQGSSDLIAIMVPNLKNPFFGEIVTAIEMEATKYNLQILLCDTNDSREKVEYFLETIADNYAFGAVICTLQVTENDLDKLENKGVHTVTIDRSFFNHPYSAVNIDQLSGAFIATKHLIDSGAKKIVYLSGPKGDLLTSEREKGYNLALNVNNLNYSKVVHSDFTLSGGYQIMKNLLENEPEVDGVYVSNDLMAIGTIRACKDINKSIPRDIKVVGNDNLEIDDFIEPRLTSLSQENEKVSQLIIEEFLALREGERMPKKEVIQPSLIVRETT